MAVQSGESVMFTSTIKDNLGEHMSTGITVTITVSDSTGEILVEDGEMTWNAPKSKWQYVWTAPTVETTTWYKAICRVTDVDGSFLKTSRLRVVPA